jgi:hypothetical protein
LGWLELCQQERMADADLPPVERIHDGLRQFGQAQPRGLCFVVAYVVSGVEGIVMVPLSRSKTT